MTLAECATACETAGETSEHRLACPPLGCLCLHRLPTPASVPTPTAGRPPLLPAGPGVFVCNAFFYNIASSTCTLKTNVCPLAQFETVS